MADEPKRVWILGAGFSRSLGGPLLAELLSPETRNDLERRYPDHRDIHDSVEARAVYALYQHGRWDHAEHFLHQLDTARRDEFVRGKFADVWHRLHGGAPTPELPEFKSLARAGKRILAAECCSFMQNFDPSREECDPYINWAHQLTERDTIVSFNYDTVVEQVACAAKLLDGETLHGRGVHVVTFASSGPGEKPDSRLEIHKAALAKQAMLIKVHGSVDWQAAPHRPFPFVRSPDVEHAAKATLNEDVCMGVPGPSKKESADGVLRYHWKLAEERLREADEVAFIGYGFPASDSQARMRILDALVSNSPEPSRRVGLRSPRYSLSVTLVLGPDTERVERIRCMLDDALSRVRKPVGHNDVIPPSGTYSIAVAPLLAEEYIGRPRF